MKVTIEMTPEEAKEMMGVPSTEKMQEHSFNLFKFAQDQMMENAQTTWNAFVPDVSKKD